MKRRIARLFILTECILTSLESLKILNHFQRKNWYFCELMWSWKTINTLRIETFDLGALYKWLLRCWKLWIINFYEKKVLGTIIGVPCLVTFPILYAAFKIFIGKFNWMEIHLHHHGYHSGTQNFPCCQVWHVSFEAPCRRSYYDVSMCFYMN